jgi:hypothetical protein
VAQRICHAVEAGPADEQLVAEIGVAFDCRSAAVDIGLVAAFGSIASNSAKSALSGSFSMNMLAGTLSAQLLLTLRSCRVLAMGANPNSCCSVLN